MGDKANNKLWKDAGRYVNFYKFGDGWKVSLPWRELDGPRTELALSFGYIEAGVVASYNRLQVALELAGWDRTSASNAVDYEGQLRRRPAREALDHLLAEGETKWEGDIL